MSIRLRDAIIIVLAELHDRFPTSSKKGFMPSIDVVTAIKTLESYLIDSEK